MTQFLKGRFHVPFMGDQNYRDNWDAIFGKKETPTKETLSKALDAFVEEHTELLTELAKTEQPQAEDGLAELTRLTEEYGGYDAEANPLVKEEPFVPAGHRRLPGGGVRKPRGQ